MMRAMAVGLTFVALVVPLALVSRAMTSEREAPAADEPVDWRAPPLLGTAMARPLMTPAEAVAETVEGAPELLGIAGRLNVDAVALVRGSGGVRALKPGEGIDGWQLRSLSADAAYFTRGTQQARVPLAGDEAPPADQ